MGACLSSSSRRAESEHGETTSRRDKSKRGAASRTALDLKSELFKKLIQLRFTPRDTAAMRSFLQVHVSDLKRKVEVDAYSVLCQAAMAGHPDVMLALLEAEAQPQLRAQADLHSILLHNDRVFDLNGDELDDAGIAARLRAMHQAHRVRVLPSESMSPATSACVWYDRLECLRVMVEVDPQSRGYTQLDHHSLLHLAAWYCKPRMVEYLMQSGWSLTSHDLSRNGLSPLGACMYAAPELEREAYAEAVCAVLAMLIRDETDAAGVVRASGLCDVTPAGFASPLRNPDMMPSCQHARMHVYMCVAVNAVSILPRRVLASVARWLFENSPAILHSLPLDEHVTAAGGVYLRDPLRVGSTTVLRMLGHLEGATARSTSSTSATNFYDSETPVDSGAVPASALRFAVTVDALCAIEEATRTDEERRKDNKFMRVLRKRGVSMVAFVSPTLRHWAWMRRLHAVHARGMSQV